MKETGMSTPKEEARKKILSIMAHLRHAGERAKEEGELHLGILAIKPGGGGRVVVQVAASEFMDDLALALDAPPDTEEEKLDAQAVAFLDQHGLRR
jgi:hypothetical protein